MGDFMHTSQCLAHSVVFVGVMGILGCGVQSMDMDGETLEVRSSLVELNSLSRNAMSWNGISLNGISLNGISLNALDVGALDVGNFNAITAPGPSGDLARQFMRYAVSCAFLPNQTFSFSYTDALGVVRDVVYRGELGIAPTWATGSLGVQGQELVTGCLAARVNYYEVPVTISVRSVLEPLKTLSSDAEVAQYPDVEGAFWGNMFAADPFIVSCYHSATVTNSRMYYRDCATGHVDETGAVVDCGPIHVVGPCSSFCMSLNGGGQFFPACRARPGQNNSLIKTVVTTALP
jgi:hypothetical protein